MLVVLVFEVHRGEITERAVDPHPVISDFDGLEEEASGLFPIQEDGLIEELVFESAPERFDRGIIIAVGPAAHARKDTGLFELSSIFSAGVLTAAIGMMNEALRMMLSMRQSHP